MEKLSSRRASGKCQKKGLNLEFYLCGNLKMRICWLKTFLFSMSESGIPKRFAKNLKIQKMHFYDPSNDIFLASKFCGTFEKMGTFFSFFKKYYLSIQYGTLRYGGWSLIPSPTLMSRALMATPAEVWRPLRPLVRVSPVRDRWSVPPLAGAGLASCCVISWVYDANGVVEHVFICIFKIF